jgi:hypothetical protein
MTGTLMTALKSENERCLVAKRSGSRLNPWLSVKILRIGQARPVTGFSTHKQKMMTESQKSLKTI